MHIQKSQPEGAYEPGFCHPLCAVSGIIDVGNGEREIVVAFYIPSGTSEKELKVYVATGGTQLEVEYLWPEVLTSVKQLLKFELQAGGQDRIQIYHPIFNGFRNFFSGYHKK